MGGSEEILNPKHQIPNNITAQNINDPISRSDLNGRSELDNVVAGFIPALWVGRKPSLINQATTKSGRGQAPPLRWYFLHGAENNVGGYKTRPYGGNCTNQQSM